MVVQHNLRAMNSNRMLGLTASVQSKSTEKLSSGYKINRAADDAAGLSISEKMRKQIRGLTQASLNAADGISAVQTAEGALNEVQDMLQRMNELAVKAANGTMSEDDRSYIQNEIDQLVTEIDRVAETTKFNETYLLKGDRNAEKITTFSYAEADKVTFGEGVNVLYAADGTEFRNAEALEEYLANNPDAKVYKSPAAAATDSANTGVTEVTIKKGAATPSADVTYKYSTDSKWYKSTTPSTTGAYTPAAEPTWTQVADSEVTALFDFNGGTPAAGDTIKFTAAKEAEKGKDYIVTEGTRGATGNGTVGDTTKKDEYTAITADSDLMGKLEGTTYEIYYKDSDGAYQKVTDSQVKVTAATITGTYNEFGTLTPSHDSAAQYAGAGNVSLSGDYAGTENKTYVYQSSGTAGWYLADAEGKPSGESVDFTGAGVDGVKIKEGTAQAGDQIVLTAKQADAKYTAFTAESAFKAAVEAGDVEIYKGNSTTKAKVWNVADSTGTNSATSTDNDISYTPKSLTYGTKSGETKYAATDFYYKAKEAQEPGEEEETGLTDIPAYDPWTAAVPAADSTPVDSTATPTFSEDAAYYDADGNKIAANALTNYVEYDEENNTVKFKANARPIYADKNATTAVTNDMLKDDIIVNKDALIGELELNLHVGADATIHNQISIKLDAMNAAGLGVSNLKVDGTDDENALDAIATIKEAIQKVSTQRSALGAVQNRLEHTIANLDNVVENTTAAESQIRDTDMATEMVKYSNNNILAQAGQAMLAQANQANQGVLSLLG